MTALAVFRLSIPACKLSIVTEVSLDGPQRTRSKIFEITAGARLYFRHTGDGPTKLIQDHFRRETREISHPKHADLRYLVRAPYAHNRTSEVIIATNGVTRLGDRHCRWHRDGWGHARPKSVLIRPPTPTCDLPTDMLRTRRQTATLSCDRAPILRAVNRAHAAEASSRIGQLSRAR